MKRGAYTALVTPFTDDDEADVRSLRRIVDAQLAGGIDGLVVAGTTGESATLSDDEKKAALDAVLEVARGRVPVVLGTGSNSTKNAVRATKQAAAWGADLALVVCPYYNKPTQEGLFRHFVAVHEESGIPVIAYNVPGRTASDLLPETIARLVEAEAIVAVKDATGDMRRVIDTLALIDSKARFALFSGDDFTILPFVACGGVGAISVASNLVPGDTARLVREAEAGELAEARPLQERISALSRALFSVSSPIPVKAAMSLLGYCSPAVRLPLVSADDKVVATVRTALRAYGLMP